jgi:hypothetical protein
LFQQLNVPLPSGVDGTKVCYLLFTWSTIGVVDHTWIMSTVSEAWLRDPSSTLNGQPQPNPGPQPTPPTPPNPPTPPTPPTPNPTPWYDLLPGWLYGILGAAILALGFWLGHKL